MKSFVPVGSFKSSKKSFSISKPQNLWITLKTWKKLFTCPFKSILLTKWDPYSQKFVTEIENFVCLIKRQSSGKSLIKTVAKRASEPREKKAIKKVSKRLKKINLHSNNQNEQQKKYRNSCEQEGKEIATLLKKFVFDIFCVWHILVIRRFL